MQAPAALSPGHVAGLPRIVPCGQVASGQCCFNQVSRRHSSSVSLNPVRGVVSGPLAGCNNRATSDAYSLPAGKVTNRTSAGDLVSSTLPPAVKRAVARNVASGTQGVANKDEGCWWLMAGFSRPDQVLPYSSRPSIPSSSISSSSLSPSQGSKDTSKTNIALASSGAHPDSIPKPESNLGPSSSSAHPSLSSSGRLPQSSPSPAPLEANSRTDDSTLNGTGSSGTTAGESSGKSATAVTDELNQASQRTLPPPLSISNLHLQSKLGSRQLRVAYQGVPGAYSEAAAGKAYPDCDPVPCDQFEAAFQAVELWLVDRAVLPIENSLGGSIHRNYDLLLRHRLHIVGEVQMAVNHCLLGLPGTSIKDLKRVLSHPQALAQCEASLSRLGVTRESVHDTAGAAQMIATDKIADAGAIASARAAEIYGLTILAEGIQDDADNVTRFLILAREPIIPRTDLPWKTSIVFSLGVGPGVLFKALSVFALRDINLTKIESRPQKHKLQLDPDPNSKQNAMIRDAQENGYHLFDYLFYIDFQASMAEPRSQNALRHLQEFAPFLRVLGSYPMDVSPIAKL